MEYKIALAGNPNCGKTTLFNALTGSSQYVGNWPGVTVEKKEGRLKGHKDVVIQDLPGIYSLSPYTLEEVVARDYLVGEKPDAILNIVDGTNIERNLYLTTQLIELGIPVVVAVNMIDLVRKNGDKIDLVRLAGALGCQVVEMSALKGEGGMAAAEKALELAKTHKTGELPHVFTGSVEHAIAHIEESIQGRVDDRYLRWYAIKLFERDEKVLEQLGLSPELKKHLELHIADCEHELDDDAESIITNQRYSYISSVVDKAVKKKKAAHSLTVSDKIDRVVTNRIAALPIFVAVMLLVYAISMGGWTVSIGTHLTDWANDGLFGDGWFVPFTADTDAWDEASGAWEEASAIIAAHDAGESAAYLYDDESGETTTLAVNEETYQAALAVAEPDPSDYGTWVPGLPVLVENGLTAIGCNDVLQSLILDGIIGGVGAVLGFVPQMLVLFLLLSILEDVGYMARVAFIMDRIFRRFGLSGKSFFASLPSVASSDGIISMSYPARTAFFCSSILLRSRSVIFRFTVLMAFTWSTDWMCRFTIRLLSMSRKSASIRSFSSGARICTKLTAPYFLPMRNCLPVRNSKPDGAMKSLVERPLEGSHSHSNWNGTCSSMWKMACSWASLALPSNTSAATPSRLKLFSTSVSMRSNRGLAVRMLSASMLNDRYLVLMRPLLPRASWFCSICVYSTRIGSKSSPWGGIVMLLAKVSWDAARFKKDS